MSIKDVTKGANDGLRLVVVGIAALLLVSLGLVALIDLFLVSFAAWVNGLFGYSIDWFLKGQKTLLFR